MFYYIKIAAKEYSTICDPILLAASFGFILTVYFESAHNIVPSIFVQKKSMHESKSSPSILDALLLQFQVMLAPSPYLCNSTASNYFTIFRVKVPGIPRQSVQWLGLHRRHKFNPWSGNLRSHKPPGIAKTNKQTNKKT